MSHVSTPRRSRRRIALAAAGVSLIAAVAPMIGATPAGAATAPLVTTDGIGIRIDENAIVGPALEAVEDALQPYVNQKIYEGALANSVMDDPDWVQGSANLELSVDFINAGTAGYPQGGLKVRGDLQNIVMRFYRYGEWWQPECQFRVNPDDGWIDASAYINTALLPAAPLTMNPISAYWDNDPAITREVGNWTCSGYLIDEWWDGLWGSGTDVAEQLENELDGEAQTLINDLWAEHVTPVISSLNEFGITFNQVKTDNNGLIVKANTNATAGLTLPGLGGPFNVSGAEDAGVTSNVDTLLAARSEVTVTVHPNVVNQYLHALNQALFSNFNSPALPASVETFLLPPASRGLYSDTGWSMSMRVTTPYFTKPTGAGGRPQIQMPQVVFDFYNEDYVFGAIPIASFTGAAGGIDLSAEIRAGTSNWGPALASTSMTLSGMALDTVMSDPDVVSWNPSGAGVLPYAKLAVDGFSDTFLTGFLSLAPISVGGINVTLCTGCTRFSGDQRWTEYFNVG